MPYLAYLCLTLYVNSCISYCIKEDGIQKLYLKGIKYLKLQGRRTEIPLKVVNSQYLVEFNFFLYMSGACLL